MFNVQYIVFVFFVLWEWVQIVFLVNGVDFVVMIGKDFMWISLVFNILDQLVKWGVVDIMQCYGKFYCVQFGSEMFVGMVYVVE